MSVLWTIGIVLRIHRFGVPGLGWPAVLANMFFWVDLLLPSAIFAIVLCVIRGIGEAHRRLDD